MRDGAVVGSFDQQAPITALAVSAAGDVALTRRPRRQRRPLERAGRQAAPRAGGGAQARSPGSHSHQGEGSCSSPRQTARCERTTLRRESSSRRCRTRGACGTQPSPPTDGSSRRPSRTRGSGSGTRARANRVHTLDQGGFALSVAFDRTGTFFASTGANRTLRVWDARTWALLYEKVEASGRVVPVAFGPGGRLIADGQTGGLGAIRDARDGALVGRMKHDNGITDVEFDPQGNRIATASTDRTARVWAAKDGTSLSVLQGHDDTVATARFSADGRSLVTASTDGTARVWDVDDRPELRLVAMKALRRRHSWRRARTAGRRHGPSVAQSSSPAHPAGTSSGSTATTSTRSPSAPTDRSS